MQDPGSMVQWLGSRILSQDPGPRMKDQNPGSRILDPVSWIQDPGSNVLDEDPGSRTKDIKSVVVLRIRSFSWCLSPYLKMVMRNPG